MIELVNLKKRFDTKEITKGVNLSIKDGTMTCIIGRSGEGKSVLLKQIIGLIEPTSGKVLVNGIDTVDISEKDRDKIFKNFGYVFQFAALLDSLNVFENIGIKLIENGYSKKEVLPIVKEKLKMVQLSEDTLYKFPSELSGGMRKRVGLARTLITNPKIILYDEPTTGLDPITARVIQELMYNMQVKLKLTSVIITHDVNTFKYADKIALLHEGKIHGVYDAKTIWDSKDPYIYQFIRGLSEGPIQAEIPHDKDKF
ncbi:ATP-binding cassette domain-containing protein [bacterium]|nr:ATP-binding cassette domain-containing protein [bacterium]